MRYTLVLSLTIVVLTALFALQNAQPVQLRFFAWTYEGPLVMVLLVTFAVGILAGWLAAIPSAWRRARELKQLRKDLRPPPGDSGGH